MRVERLVNGADRDLWPRFEALFYNPDLAWQSALRTAVENGLAFRDVAQAMLRRNASAYHDWTKGR